MKKVLLGTTALVTAGLLAGAPSAFAAEKITAKVGGYMEQWVGYASADSVDETKDYSGFDVKSDAEVFFTGSTTLDNGLSVGVNIQLEGNTHGDTIDESYLIVKGGFGEINIGDENSAQYKMHYAPSDFGIGMNSGDQTAWVDQQAVLGMAQGTGGMWVGNVWKPAQMTPDTRVGGVQWRRPFGSTYVEAGTPDDSTKITYYTPRIEGFQLGLSYSPDMKQDSGAQPNRETAESDLFSVGANFNRAFGDASVGVSLGYGTVTNSPNDDNPSAINVGVKLGFGGFGVGASYAKSEEDGPFTGSGMNVGISYTAGPWGISLAYFGGEQDGVMSEGMMVDGMMTEGMLSGQAELDTFHLSTKYALGPGITAAGTLGYSKVQTDDTMAVGTDAASIDGTYAVVGLKVSF